MKRGELAVGTQRLETHWNKKPCVFVEHVIISSLQVMQLRETLQSTCAEKERLLSEATKESLVHMAEVEQIQADLASVTQERDQLLELLQGLREEKIQLTEDLQEKDEMVNGKKSREMKLVEKTRAAHFF